MIGPFAGSEPSRTGVTKQTIVAADSIDAEALARLVDQWRTKTATVLDADTALARPLSSDVSSEAFFTANRWAFRLRAQVWGERYREIVIRHPAGWWQALRERFAPRWWIRRYPVRMVVHTIAPRIIYPQLRVAMPDQAHVLHLDRYTHETPGPDDE